MCLPFYYVVKQDKYRFLITTLKENNFDNLSKKLNFLSSYDTKQRVIRVLTKVTGRSVISNCKTVVVSMFVVISSEVDNSTFQCALCAAETIAPGPFIIKLSLMSRKCCGLLFIVFMHSKNCLVYDFRTFSRKLLQQIYKSLFNLRCSFAVAIVRIF